MNDPSAKDIRQARAFRLQAAHFRRIGNCEIADALVEAADALAPEERDEHGLTEEQYRVRVDRPYEAAFAEPGEVGS